MKGLSLASLRTHPSLIPLFACVVVGAGAASAYLFRLATKCPDVAWTRANNSEPWQVYKDKRYKLHDAGNDYKEFAKPPEF